MLTAPEETVKKLEEKDAIPLLVSVASSPEMVTVPAASDVSIPSPPAMVRVPPKETAEDPESPAKVMEEFASSEFATQATQVNSDAVMVPVPEKVRDDPFPTTMAAVVLVPDVISPKDTASAVTPDSPEPSPYITPPTSRSDVT